MTTTTLISKTSSTGKTIEIVYDGRDFVATLDGVEYVRSTEPGWRGRANGQNLHFFGIAGGRMVGLTYAEGDILRNTYNTMLASIVVEPSRADLVARYHALIEDQADAFERAHDRQNENAWSIKASYDAKIEAAAQAIRDYDAAHPEETAAREAERAASVERNRWM